MSLIVFRSFNRHFFRRKEFLEGCKYISLITKNNDIYKGLILQSNVLKFKTNLHT